MAEPAAVPLPSPVPLPLLDGRRLAAGAIDWVAFAGIGWRLFPFGFVAATLYFLVGLRYRTVGQRIAGLVTVEAGGGRPGWGTSFLRALPWHVALALNALPVWGPRGRIPFALLLLAAEVWLHLRAGWRRGLGDLLAGTVTGRPGRNTPPAFHPAGSASAGE